MTDFANYIIRNKVVGYPRILIEARSEGWQLSREDQLEAIITYLRNKLRVEVNNHPFFKTLLHQSPQEVKMALF